jgi:hypothetical protein
MFFQKTQFEFISDILLHRLFRSFSLLCTSSWSNSELPVDGRSEVLCPESDGAGGGEANACSWIDERMEGKKDEVQ